jgi:hypothetical protein
MHNPDNDRSEFPPIVRSAAPLVVEPDPARDYQRALLGPLAHNPQTYRGDHDEAAVRRRRAANKAARKARRANRR